MNGVTANITNVNATTVDATNVEVTNVKAKDGTAAIVISDTSGNVGIGGTAQGNIKVHALGTYPVLGGNANCAAFGATGTFPTSITGSARGFFSSLATAASATTTSVLHFNAGNTQVGAGATLTNEIGFFAGSGITSGTNNYGFYGDIASGSNRYNVYMAGTADNYFAGNVGIGTASPVGKLDIISGTARIYISNQSASGFITAVNTTNTAYAPLAINGSELVLKTGDATRATIDSSGNVGIGRTSPGAKLDVAGDVFITKGSSPLFCTGDNQVLRIGVNQAESMRISTSNNVGIGQTNPNARLDVLADSGDIGRFINSSVVGVSIAAGNNTWTSLSDESVKTDLVPIADAIPKIASLRAVTGRFTSDNVGVSRAFLIAQDVQKVFPEAVNVVDKEKNLLGLAYTDVIPLLVKAVQELTARVAELEAK
jgi:hypothetical protein